MEVIRFYKAEDEYGDFSNFASFPIFINGEVWSTLEHYYQTNKFEELSIRNKIKTLDSPMKAATVGRNSTELLRGDWNEVKDNVMLQGLFAKFLQHYELKVELLSTGNAEIVEHTENDSYWGDAGDGSGLNKLGLLLMKVRKEITEINNDPQVVFPPWIAFPGVGQHDVFWRRGLGEDYMDTWSRYYLATENKQEYRHLFPEPSKWEGFFDLN